MSFNRTSRPTVWAMPRRAFLGGAAMAGASALLLPQGLRAQSSAPQRGGHLVLGIDNASTSDRLDPAYYWEQFNYHCGTQLFDTLTDLDTDGSLMPALAEAWEPRNGGQQWVFTLRSGVTFHNGRSLVPEDVIYSLNHHRGETTESAGKSYLMAVTGIAKTGAMEVTIDLDAPNADFPYLLSDIHYVITFDGANFDEGIGTGPYVLEHFEPGQRLMVRRNENYWNPARGFVETIETLAYNDPSARVAALMSGTLHFANNITSQVASRLRSMGQVQVLEERDSQIGLFVGRTDQGAFANPDVRRAVKYAVQRDEMVSALFEGSGSVSHDNPLFPSSRYFSADLPRHDYDADKAAHYWKKSGYDGPIRLSVADGATFAGAVECAQLMQASASAAGLPFEIDRVPADGYWSEVWMKHDFCSSIWSARPTADALLSLLYHSKSTWNETYWNNSQFDGLITAARGELDEGRRRALYHDAQLLIVEESASVIPVYRSMLNAGAPNLHGFVAVPGQIAQRVGPSVWLEA